MMNWTLFVTLSHSSHGFPQETLTWNRFYNNISQYLYFTPYSALTLNLESTSSFSRLVSALGFFFTVRLNKLKVSQVSIHPVLFQTVETAETLHICTKVILPDFLFGKLFLGISSFGRRFQSGNKMVPCGPWQRSDYH